ncbi:hypothetical protein [Legionella fallonii]|uniref:ATP-grasp domain-containing protein n=1 Tax=Legionella fallonii LLAP-10 TaxID=1212491 RepID=A0A098G059_9GAMM|nr:hypothetical protein [Legionella fallonii]CEG55858.1 conserved protein of unknown function [Legionella fallonii LLAP-10]
MNKNAEQYYQSALDLCLAVTPIPEIDGFDLYLGKTRYFCRGVVNCFNDHCSVSIARNKYCSNKLLENAGFPVPKAIAISKTDFEEGNLEEYLVDLKFPLVIKPTQDGRRGRDVLCNIQSVEELKRHLTSQFLTEEFISIEEFHGNLKSYRVLIFKNKLLGVVRRYPAHVVGDGQHNIQELIDLSNIKRQKISDMLAPIVVDDEVQIRLKELGLTLNSIPYKGESVTLCYVCNTSRGGTYEPLGKNICKENKRMLIRAAHTLNLNLVGFDIECADINRPIETTAGVIIEANANPSVRIHELAITGGIPHGVTKTILRALIYRHPLSYLWGLYKNKRTAFYIRSLMLIIVATLCAILIGIAT